MSSLDSTDLAGLTTDDKNLYLFYQKSGNIVEAFSENGGSPSTQSVQVASDAQDGGSPLTAYFVKEDMNYDKQPTIHMIYINKDGSLVETVRRLSQDKWEEAPKPPGKAVQQSRIVSGVSQMDRGPDSPPGSQWVYFTSQDGNKLPITELRRNNKGNFHLERVLPEESLSLPGTHLACVITQDAIDLYHQDHEKNIKRWRHDTQKGGPWENKGTVIDGKRVMVRSPLASVNFDGKNHLLYADDQLRLRDLCEGKNLDVAPRVYAGAGINALVYKREIILFYKLIHPEGAIGTAKFTEGKWKEEGVFIK
ncbi:protein kinase ssp1 [Aspergillus hancockii]|nr:protein kinase ssp1 [Aspergillus hancockii]